MRTCLFVSLLVLAAGCKPKPTEVTKGPEPARVEPVPQVGTGGTATTAATFEKKSVEAPVPEIPKPPVTSTQPTPKPPAKVALEWPVSEGTANKRLVGLTDDEVKALIGKPDQVSNSSDLAFIEWLYSAPKWLAPAEGAVNRNPTGMILQLRDGIVRRVYRWSK